MGHCDSSAHLGQHGGVFVAHAGTAENFASSGARSSSRELTSRGRSAAAWILLFFVRFYIAFLSPFLGGACKFHPSCSNYAQEAISRHGAQRGFVLAMKRLGRCRPFTKGGFDPVPETLDSCDSLEAMR